MRVALDATPLGLSSGGLARYVTQLAAALASGFPQDEFVPLFERPKHPLDRWWWAAGAPRELARIHCDLFHGTNFVVPWPPLLPNVLTLHDLSPWLDPSWHSGAGFVRRRTPVQLGLGLATMVVTHTEAVRREAIDWFRLHPSRVVAVPLAADHLKPAPAKPWPAPYLVFVGALEPRKNLGMLLQAWREVYSLHGTHLLLAGRRREDFTLSLAPEPGLHWLGEIPDDELPALYSGSVASLYPSLYEGFGLPVLEAMQCGAPVIASQCAAVREVAGEAAVLLDARDTRSWVEAMSAAVALPGWAHSRRVASLERARCFSWARTARLTREIYQEALRRWGQ
jgi:glycosyltransferase involved in cell wall biosynthesis